MTAYELLIIDLGSAVCSSDLSPVADRVSGDGLTRWAEIINLQGRRSARSDGERPWRRPSPDRAGRTEAVEGVCPLCERHAPLAQGRDGLWRRGPEAPEAARRRGAAGSRTAQILQGLCGVDGMDEPPLSARAQAACAVGDRRRTRLNSSH